MFTAHCMNISKALQPANDVQGDRSVEDEKLKYLGQSRMTEKKSITGGEMTDHLSPFICHKMCSTRLNHRANDF